MSAAVSGERVWPVLPAETILQSHRAAYQALYLRAGVSAALWQRYYAPVMEHLAGYLQQLPDPKDPTRSLLANLFEQAAGVLQRRKGLLLPPGASSEQIAAQHDHWTYALWSVALIRPLPHELSPLWVTLAHSQTDREGLWVPWETGLDEAGAEHYRLQPYPNPEAPLADWALLVVPQLMPSRGLEWLWSAPPVWTAWEQALSEPTPPASLQAVLASPTPSPSF